MMSKKVAEAIGVCALTTLNAPQPHGIGGVSTGVCRFPVKVSVKGVARGFWIKAPSPGTKDRFGTQWPATLVLPIAKFPVAQFHLAILVWFGTLGRISSRVLPPRSS